MARYVAFKVSLYNGSGWDSAIEFDDKEVMDGVHQPNISSEIMMPNDSLPILLDVARIAEDADRDAYRITVNIKTVYADTQSKIESIVESSYKARVYYAPKILPTTYITCVIDPNYSEEFYSGENLYEAKITLEFEGECE